MALLDFDTFWTKVHECLFSNDLWWFDEDTDRLIQMYPEPFWEEMVMLLVRWTGIELGVLAVIGLLIKRQIFRSASRVHDAKQPSLPH